MKLKWILFSNVYTESVTLGKENYSQLCAAWLFEQLFADAVTFAAAQLLSHETDRKTSKAFLKITVQ